jgi:hypothetical protein
MAEGDRKNIVFAVRAWLQNDRIDMFPADKSDYQR